ncbi:hypothetical protein [Actinoplanes derwentensis]|uniref:Uncharacterized protein n=1 Tax=Actinoplanes derwentensis TaxID=113562 RepID=A0A1H2D6U6_9ACTN|nr:hypothetical protein [Actinoplanes derwentensis]GID89451.1 hypothetical protein Ade03nite_83750 [Actinoplanes derwentensis]SDT78485.1 hypothetical protein SAMN04489716_8393 [Actinoplanes derwentensis]
MKPSDDDRLRAALRAEAAAHQPDRAAMFDRITASAMRDSGHRLPARRGPRMRTAAVAAAVAVLFGGGGVGTWALTSSSGRPEAAPTPAPVTAAPSPVDTAPVSVAPFTPSPSPSLLSLKPSPSASPAQEKTTPPVEQGPLWADGSVVSEGSSVVTLKTTETLTSLTVVIRVARTEGLVARSGAKSTPGASVTTTVTEDPDAFVYRFVMAPADTLAPGTYTFAARYKHPPGSRDAGGDTYVAESGSLKVSGDFF